MIELAFILLAGLCVGSFITCASYRLPLAIDVVKKPSYCPACEHRLGFRDLWPVLSWLASGGACRHCKSKISVRYPAIELLNAALFLVIYANYGFSLQALLLMLLATCLLIMIVADLEHYIIPDEIHLALLPLGLGYHALIGSDALAPAWGFLLGAGVGLSLHYGYGWLRKKDVLGYGDVKFLAVAGLWLTLLPFVPFIFYAGILGVVFGMAWRLVGRGAVFPFGPALAASLFICVAFPKSVEFFWNFGHGIAP